MDEQSFRTYIGHFNRAEYDQLVRWFADDVTLSFPDGRVSTTLSSIWEQKGQRMSVRRGYASPNS